MLTGELRFSLSKHLLSNSADACHANADKANIAGAIGHAPPFKIVTSHIGPPSLHNKIRKIAGGFLSGKTLRQCRYSDISLSHRLSTYALELSANLYALRPYNIFTNDLLIQSFSPVIQETLPNVPNGAWIPATTVLRGPSTTPMVFRHSLLPLRV